MAGICRRCQSFLSHISWQWLFHQAQHCLRATQSDPYPKVFPKEWLCQKTPHTHTYPAQKWCLKSLSFRAVNIHHPLSRLSPCIGLTDKLERENLKDVDAECMAGRFHPCLLSSCSHEEQSGGIYLCIFYLNSQDMSRPVTDGGIDLYKFSSRLNAGQDWRKFP